MVIRERHILFQPLNLLSLSLTVMAEGKMVWLIKKNIYNVTNIDKSCDLLIEKNIYNVTNIDKSYVTY
jgi:hypothetical protein